MMRLILLAIVCFFIVQPCFAKDSLLPEMNEPVAFAADEMVYNRDLSIVTASGNVEIIQSGNILKADTISYNMKENMVTASGNIVLVQPDGSVVFADYSELSDDLKNGIIKNFRTILSDKSKMAAASAIRKEGIKNELENAVYSTCDVCCGKEPLWQIKALHVIHNQETKDIVYRNAWVEIKGVPVLYAPYLSHPDPSIKRRSGFLTPKFGGTKTLGASAQIPYFWDISPEKDITISPIISSDEGGVFVGEYRGRYDKGEINLETSLTKDSKGEVKSHINSNINFDIDNTWRAKTKIQRSSDDTYLKRYGLEIDGSPWLTVHGEIEGFDRRSYAVVQGYSFQDLREDVKDESTPLVVPVIDYNFVGEPQKHGGYWTFDASGSALTRKEGVGSQRTSIKAGWHLPYTSPNGEVYSLSSSVRGDAYYVNNVLREEGTTYDGFTGRVHPQLSLEWRYPLARREEASRQVIEPIIMGVVAPNGNNSEKIPNEDSRDLEFDDTNVLSENHFVGFDRIEAGSRINYGLKWSVYGHELGQASAFLGQSYRFLKDSIFPDESGLEKRSSDYVGRIFASPSEELELMYRFRLDRTTLESRRNEVMLTAGPSAFQISSDYMFVNASNREYTDFDDREELGIAINSKISRYWSTGIHNRHDLADGGGSINWGGFAAYENECFRFDAKLDRDYTHDRDYEGGYSIMFSITLKPLGQIKTGRQKL